MGAARIWGVAGLTLAAVTAGCQPKPQAGADSAPATRQAHIAEGATTQPADGGSAEALARKAEEWARMLEAIKAKREAAATQPVLTATTQPAVVEEPTSRPVVATSRPVEPKPTVSGAGLVFDPPAATKPIIEVYAPVNPTTQQVAKAPPKVVVKDALAEKAEAAVKASPRDAAANLDYQLVRFLKEEQSPDLATLSSLPSEDREAISAVMDGLANFRAVLRGDPNGMTSKKVRPLVDMGERLRAQGDLQVQGMALCTAVRGYGVYEPLKGAFIEGRENKALLYCEVNGFASRVGEGGIWETRLNQELVLYRGETEVWKKGKVDEIVDRCRNKRRDFYTMNLIALPGSLPAGSYTLKVTVIDQVANRVAEAIVPVTIVGAGVASGKS